MADTIKALVVVFPVLFGVFFFARFIFAPVIEPKRMDRWAMIFLTVTVIGFLIPNYWVMCIVVVMFLAGVVFFRIEENLPALFALLVCALPPNSKPIPGFAGINELFPISPPLLLSIMLLFVGLFYFRRITAKLHGIVVTDICMFLYIGVVFALAFRDTTVTDGLRIIWVSFFTVFLPYFIFSRWAKTYDDLKIICTAIIVPLLALSATAFLEPLFNWHFYAMPAQNWHGASPYALRSGLLRVYASVLGPIEFGFLVMIAMTLALPMLGSKLPKIPAYAGISGFAGALLLTFSRGPWLGAVISIAMYVVSGPKGLSRGVVAGFASIFLFIILALSPFGDKVLGILPFFGDVDGEYETFSYREKLFRNGSQVIMENPFFGSTKFWENPKMQELIQGQGIIDLVNSYIQVGLNHGLVGLSLFVGILFSSCYGAYRAMRLLRPHNRELSAYARAFFASMAGIIVLIATTASNSQVPIFYWMLAGLCVSIRRLSEEQKKLAFAGVIAGGGSVDGGGSGSQVTSSHPSSELSLRRAQESTMEEEPISAEARLHAERNTAKKEAAKRRSVPAHLRQYVPKD